MKLCVIETHPIQYHAPVYRELQQRLGIPVTVIYGSDFSIVGGLDREFGTAFAWDTDLLSGYHSEFLSRVQPGQASALAHISAQGLRQRLRQVYPDATLLAGYSPRFHQVAFYAAWRLGRPILFRGETTDHAGNRSRFKSLARDFLLRRLYRRCRRLSYVGCHSRRHFERLGVPPEKLIFSPYCVDTTPFQCGESDRYALRQTLRANLGLEESRLVILFSGKISFRKGPDLLLEAVKGLPEALRQRAHLLFLGDGDMRAAVAAAAQQEPKVSTHFVGFKNQKELSPYYHAADLLVLPSRFGETWGLVVNEALHHGVPAVVSEAVGCAPDLIEAGATGEVFATEAVPDFTRAIQFAMQLAGREEIRSNCRAKADQYSIARAAEGLAQAFKETTDR